MAKLKGIKHEKQTPHGNMKVEFTRESVRHLPSSFFGGKKALNSQDVKHVERLARESVYVTEGGLSKERSDKISKFYYFKARYKGRDLYFNVAEKAKKTNHGIRLTRFYFAMTHKIKTE